jgi:hypothetical protein
MYSCSRRVSIACVQGEISNAALSTSKSGKQQTFLIPGTFGVNSFDSSEITSWISNSFSIVFRAFMILLCNTLVSDGCPVIPYKQDKCVPDNGR